MADIVLILIWWLTISIFGWVVWPVTWKWFGNFWDKGYGFSKMVGMAFVSWVVWVLAITKLLPFERITIVLVLAVIGILCWVKIRDDAFINWNKQRWRIIFLEELLFLGALVFWSSIRAYQPDIEGLEKFMDFGFMNSILRGKYFPPVDMWWSGGIINYYYFGHYISALFTKLSGIDSAITYNLAIAHLFALGSLGAFTLGSNLIKPLTNSVRKMIWAGMLCAFLVNLGGNWHTIYAFFKAYNPESPVPFWQLEFMKGAGGVEGSIVPATFNEYWYPNATRFIPFTIHEFPIYSYVVADLHGHVSDIPFVLLFLGLLVNLTYRVKEKIGVKEIIPLGFLLGIMLMTNYWDLPIYGLVLGVTLFIWEYKKNRDFWGSCFETIWRGLVVLVTTLVTSSGFIYYFKQIAEGIKPVNARSELYQLAILYGWPLFCTLTFLVLIWLNRKKKILKSDLLVIGWVGVAWFLIVLPELIYVKDIYIAEYHRANTMFKLVYQSFVIFGISSVYILFRVWLSRSDYPKIRFRAWSLVAGLGLILVAIYPWLAIRSYYGLKEYKGLYGMKFLENTPGDLAGINWLKKNIDGQPVVLEAPGDSYTIYNRVSAMTGLPTIVGWAVHEWLWRGEGYDPVGSRITEVEQIYTDADINIVRQKLEKYNVKYIFVGNKEREKYAERLNEQNIASLGEKVFDVEETRIYKLN